MGISCASMGGINFGLTDLSAIEEQMARTAKRSNRPSQRIPQDEHPVAHRAINSVLLSTPYY